MSLSDDPSQIITEANRTDPVYVADPPETLAFESNDASVVLAPVNEDVTFSAEEVQAVFVDGERDSLVIDGGPSQGPPGRDGAQLDLVFPSAQALSAHRALVLGIDGRLDYADPTSTDAWAVAGISVNAVASADQPVTLRTSGLMTEPSWSWTALKPVWLGADGTLTQSPDDNANLVEIGIALSATSILIRIQQAVFTPE